RRALAVGAFAELAGPPVGVWLILIPMAVRNGVGADGPLGIVSAIGGLTMMSYVFGGLPALVAAVVVGTITYRRGRYGYGHAVSAAVLGTLAMSALLAVGDAKPADEFVSIAQGIAPLAVGSALICRWLTKRLGLLPGREAPA
ncbi:MAG TPA: hypothetical protein PLQ11_11160, partial [Beijerinckiaceae bacterium]|nr:hypothetical protein [Beijerinckiaceae bacterium]